ncbi:hypothetical protein AJ80_08089 [Polytolypa hystricis UAMH7299]|uniref:Methyltransferase small domain-containing protein n=1 Tax=Polytolypa hystricis (strain UAMH7299) TaxID=1447883 RepID=A0A2B7XCF2_POLH7|nr:hypothetical protein AJ80_08089 [Polytolypa hystricis UAMH7299]
MLPTPSTSHVCFDNIYEPAEDSYLFLDTLSSATEAAWLSRRFNNIPSNRQSTPSGVTNSPSPLVVEVGTGSGVVLAFAAANAQLIFGREDILTLGTDVNRNACSATRKTVQHAMKEQQQHHQHQQLLGTLTADLCNPLRSGAVDVLIFNPPYVPTPDVPPPPLQESGDNKENSKFESDSHLLSLSYAGGELGMETTNRLLDMVPGILDPDRGVAYVLLCAQNKPDEVKQRIAGWGSGWMVETVGRSGVKAGWERLSIIRIWRELPS